MATLRKSRVGRAMDNYNAKRSIVSDIDKQYNSNPNNISYDNYRYKRRLATYNELDAKHVLDAETRMAKDYYKKRKSSQK